eukprot:CAMPEP_0115866356 /NCGR_PEP_ID=MMETSP0287-20121206/20205_1 /TAXON_ID=412157 /ORGANISM="Chrysochromulina rotalis, Strain UIO044" /LENGTH=216 /DNA_ID=CAMNT_0003320917 /DNA_START=104 /DNA_END=754 /DNA_ORIENTATION=-
MQAEFVAENFGPHKMDLKIEEDLGVVPPALSKTSKMNDPGPPRQMRVKSGYTGHVPHGRDFVGGSYHAHDNRGTAGKETVPVMHATAGGGYPVKVAPPRSPISSLIHQQDPHCTKPGDRQHDYGLTTTAPVPARVEKVLSGDTRDMDDADNRASAFDKDGAGQWIMSGYTGHVPKGKEVYGTSFYGPPEGPSYHGPYYTSDKYYAPSSPNKEAICP